MDADLSPPRGRAKLIPHSRPGDEKLLAAVGRDTDRLKEEFFELVSHELRTPLTSIIGYLELMLEQDGRGVEFRLERGYEILTAPDGEAAVRLAREHQPDIAILDVRMPKLDGYEVTKLIRRSEAVRDIPVILLSASVEDMHIQRGYDAGANHYMHKPFSPQDLVEHVAGALREGTGASATAE